MHFCALNQLRHLDLVFPIESSFSSSSPKIVEVLVVGMITEAAYRTVDDNAFCTTSTSWVSFGLSGDNEHGGDDMDWIISSTNDDGKAFIFGASSIIFWIIFKVFSLGYYLLFMVTAWSSHTKIRSTSLSKS